VTPVAPSAEAVAEAEAFARYLVGRPPAPALVARYVAARATLFPAEPEVADERALVAFARRHPWSVGPLDAVCALLRPTGALRSRLLVMAAILEASPAGADDFLPRDASVPALAWRLGTSGAAAVLRVLAGLVLWPVARRGGR
jgi:hypothetical protein